MIRIKIIERRNFKKREAVPDLDKRKMEKKGQNYRTDFLKVGRTMYIGIPKRNEIKHAQLNHYTSG